MIVAKFGGTSVADAERIRGVAAIVRDRLERRPVVVVSALARVTDLLVRAYDHAARGDLADLEPVLAEIERRHRWALGAIVESSRERHALDLEIDRLTGELKERLRSIRILGEGTPRMRDAVLAFGETASARLVAAALIDAGIPASLVDPRRVLVTDDRFGEATPDLDRVAERAATEIGPLVAAGRVPVLGGFVGATPGGETTTLGRGGSDTSAAVLGAALGADEIQIWTDVDGILSADPRLVGGARTMPEVSFAEAAELAFYGAKVLHPDSVAPAVRRGIPVRVLNALRPEGAGTLVVEERAGSTCGLVSVASRRAVRVIRVSGPRLGAVPERLPEVGRALAALGTAPDLLVASEVALALVVPDSLDAGRFASCLPAGHRTETHDARAIVCLVGAGLRDDQDLRARALAAAAALAPEILQLGAAGTSLALVVAEGRLEAAVRGLHRTFFESEPA